MKLPRIQFTTRRWLAAVLVVAVGLSAPSWAKTAYRNHIIARQLGYHPPVALDLWRGKVVAGDPVERVISRYPPHRVTRRGAFVQLRYEPGGPCPPGSISLAGTSILAKDGALVGAGSWECTFQHVHFDVMSESDKIAFDNLLRKYPGKHPELGDSP